MVGLPVYDLVTLLVDASTLTGRIKQSALCCSMENALMEMVTFVFSTPEVECGMSKAERENLAAKILGYFLNTLRYFESDSACGNGLPVNPRQTTLSQHQRSSLQSMSSPDIPTTQRLLSLKVIQKILMGIGCNLDSARRFVAANKHLANLVRDDLGQSLVFLLSGRDSGPLLLQSVLSIFGSLFLIFGPALRVTIECFCRYVFIRALYQIDELLSHELDGTGGKSIHINGPQRSFTVEELEIILESLADLMSDAGFLPSLFLSFDCDPTTVDIAQPMVDFLSKCAHKAIIIQGKGINHDIPVLILNCFGQLIRTFSMRSSMLSPLVDDVETTFTKKVDIDKEYKSVTNLFNARRKSKMILSEASKKFSEKPELGLFYLQEMGCLPSPPSPESVATFLRVSPELPKEIVGAYLGELGKELSGQEFHRRVLLCYVKSFALAGQGVLNCMRIFLSAFRLPGEAQQIDRILVAFSEYCYLNCLEGTSGLLENADITYLLTFSIIMLNTDRHNPNIRADRKMTIEQFVRNNTNYGSEVKQTKPLPKVFLEEIYASISICPIRTERNDISAELTREVWMDMQLQGATDAMKGTIISCCHGSDVIHSLVGSWMVAKYDISTSHENIVSPMQSVAQA